jgi:hypothetical protein
MSVTDAWSRRSWETDYGNTLKQERSNVTTSDEHNWLESFTDSCLDKKYLYMLLFFSLK